MIGSGRNANSRRSPFFIRDWNRLQYGVALIPNIKMAVPNTDERKDQVNDDA
jgi:hypothetical protein